MTTPPVPGDPSPDGSGGDTVPLDLNFTPGRYPRTAQQLAYDVLRRSIMNGTIPPGTRLTQTQVALQLSLSTTPVREALRRLAGDELVRIDAHRGAIVRGLDEHELREIYELRLLLEPLGIQKAVDNITEQELALAEELCRRMDDSSDLEAWSGWNRDFHAIFARSANSANLTRILQGLRDSAARYVQRSIVAHPEFPKAANDDHQRLLDACRARDGKAAAAIEREHLMRTLGAVLETFGAAPS